MKNFFKAFLIAFACVCLWSSFDTKAETIATVREISVDYSKTVNKEEEVARKSPVTNGKLTAVLTETVDRVVIQTTTDGVNYKTPDLDAKIRKAVGLKGKADLFLYRLTCYDGMFYVLGESGGEFFGFSTKDFKTLSGLSLPKFDDVMPVSARNLSLSTIDDYPLLCKVKGNFVYACSQRYQSKKALTAKDCTGYYFCGKTIDSLKKQAYPDFTKDSGYRKAGKKNRNPKEIRCVPSFENDTFMMRWSISYSNDDPSLSLTSFALDLSDWSEVIVSDSPNDDYYGAAGKYFYYEDLCVKNGKVKIDLGAYSSPKKSSKKFSASIPASKKWNDYFPIVSLAERRLDRLGFFADIPNKTNTSLFSVSISGTIETMDMPFTFDGEIVYDADTQIAFIEDFNDSVIYMSNDGFRSMYRFEKPFDEGCTMSVIDDKLEFCYEDYTYYVPLKKLRAPKISSTKENVEAGDSFAITTIGTVAKSYTSSDKSVAKVDANGKVTAVGNGRAVISVKCKNGKTYKCTVTVGKANDDAEKPTEKPEEKPVETPAEEKGEKALSSQEVYQKCFASVVEIQTDVAIGSGFFIDSSTIVTNYHVIEDAKSIYYIDSNGSMYSVETIKGYDENLDIALLKATLNGTPLAKNSHGISTGEVVYTLGSSKGLTDTFANGIVTNENRVLDGVRYIQTNAAISPGNSGGPLLNSYGEVMGINTLTHKDGQNLNFAINIEEVGKVSTSNPISVNEFARKNGGGSDPGYDPGYNDPGYAAPNCEVVLVYGEEYSLSPLCGVYIVNNGKKDLIVGGSYSINFAHVYPYEGANYTTAHLMAKDTFEIIPSQTIAAGEGVLCFFLLEEDRMFAGRASIAFSFRYDGIDYTVVADSNGYATWTARE